MNKGDIFFKKAVTTPIFYPNSKAHLGTIHTVILADFINRLLGGKLYSGTDEHGNKISKTAKSLGLSPKEFVDKQSEGFKRVFSKLEINLEEFIRTTDKRHIDKVKEIWKILEDKGLIYKGIYEGFYSERDESFYKESELINGLSPTGAPVELIKEECFYFKLSSFEGKLKEYYNSNPTIPSNRVEELRSFVNSGLRDLCVSRNIDWGIEIENSSQVIYVWLDALVNYLTTIEDWENTDVIHVIGKDIAIFHGVYWPAILMGIGKKKMPKILVHNWWKVEGDKMSKSLGNIIDPEELIEKYSIYPLRFFIIKENLLSADGNFSEERMVETFNSFLVNKFSNLLYRLMTLAKNNNLLSKLSIDNNFLEEDMSSIIDSLDINEYIQRILKECDLLNKEIEDKKIWEKKEDNLNIIKELLEKTVALSRYFDPILPNTYNRILKQIKSGKIEILFKRI